MNPKITTIHANQREARRTARLLRCYWWLYAIACASVAMLGLAALRHAIEHQHRWAGLVAALAIGGLVFGILLRVLEFRAHRRIPGPRPDLFLGNLGELLAHGHGSRDHALIDLHAQFGPIVRLHLAWGSRPCVSLSTPSGTIRRRDLDSFRSADRSLLPVSLMGMAMGEVHDDHRKQLQPLFGKPAVQAKLAIVRALADRYVDTWTRGDRLHGDLQADIHHWSAHCLGSVLFGPAWDSNAELGSYLDAIGQIEDEISFRSFHPPFVRWLFIGRGIEARAAYQVLSEFLGRVRDRHVEDPQRSDSANLLDQLVALEQSGRWTRAECIEEMMSLILGGTDAMSYLISQALVSLAHAPDLQAQARRALARGDHADPLIRSIVHETMRLFPPVPFSSKFAERAVIEAGHTIPAGTRLLWMKTVVGRNPQVFAEPERFAPNRFAAAQPSRESIHDAAPFGGGVRRCIGHHLAEVQCAVFLAAILERFQLEPIPDVEVEFRATVSIKPSTVPVRLILADSTG